MRDWFTAHKEGFRQIHERLVARRGFGLIGGELYQNVMDTDATTCDICVEKIRHKPRIKITCEDDGPGFADLTHAWTMFSPSEKKADPTKAGRFNIGEKVVLSFAYEASIHTTSGMVVFDEHGRREYPRQKREQGTIFQAELACTEERFQQLIDFMHRILVRPGLTLKVNGDEVPVRKPIHTFECQLPTEMGDDLRPTRRITKVEIYNAVESEIPMLYELGIPVVETGDRWHYNVCQKVPLNVDRDNVTPAFLRQVRVAVFNEMHTRIEDDDTITPWVEEATSDERCSDEAAETFRKRKYGDKSVSLDPTNPEANAEATANGFIVIPSRGLTKGQRANLKAAGVLQSSSQAFPTAGKGAYSDDPNASPVRVLTGDEITPAMTKIKEYAEGLGQRLMGIDVEVKFVWCDKFGEGKSWAACYCRGHVLAEAGRFDFNVFRLGRKWFEKGATPRVDGLILHEFGHEYESNHLSSDYHNALTRLGALLKVEVLKDAQWFGRFV